MVRYSRFGAVLAVAGLVAVGITAIPGKAEAWWRGGCCAIGIGIAVPPLVVAPPVYAPPPAYYYAPPPVAYYPPQRVWVPPHWQGGVWVPGHWA